MSNFWYNLQKLWYICGLCLISSGYTHRWPTESVTCYGTMRRIRKLLAILGRCKCVSLRLALLLLKLQIMFWVFFFFDEYRNFTVHYILKPLNLIHCARNCVKKMTVSHSWGFVTVCTNGGFLPSRSLLLSFQFPIHPSIHPSILQKIIDVVHKIIYVVRK